MGKNGTRKKLTPRQRKAVQALLTTGDKDQAAAAAGCARRTIYRWLRLDVFQQALTDAEADALAELSRELVRLAGLAAGTLEQAMGDRDATAGQRIRAADIVLSRLLQLRQLVDLEQRIQALEAGIR